MVLDVIVSPARQMFGNLRPFVAENCMILQNEHVLLLGPTIFLDFRIKMVMPSTRF